MTGEKVKQVLQFYREQINAIAKEMSAEDKLEKCPHVDFYTLDKHIAYCCEEAQKFIDEGRTEKAMRWLGFIQGVLYRSGLFSIEDLKHHSMP